MVCSDVLPAGMVYSLQWLGLDPSPYNLKEEEDYLGSLVTTRVLGTTGATPSSFARNWITKSSFVGPKYQMLKSLFPLNFSFENIDIE